MLERIDYSNPFLAKSVFSTPKGHFSLSFGTAKHLVGFPYCDIFRGGYDLELGLGDD